MRHKRANRVKRIRKVKRRTIEEYAEKMRKNPTRAELVLWSSLSRKMKQWDVTFVSQGVLIDRYIGDFVCYSHMLVIEVDGSIHKLKHVKNKDALRTSELNQHGYRVVRFSNSCVLRYTYMVLIQIENEIKRNVS